MGGALGMRGYMGALRMRGYLGGALRRRGYPS